MSKQCSETPICDFCALFDWNSAFDKKGINVAKGLCYRHRRMVDASDGCSGFVCKICAKAAFCSAYKDKDGRCGGYYEGQSLHPMCVECKEVRNHNAK